MVVFAASPIKLGTDKEKMESFKEQITFQEHKGRKGLVFSLVIRKER